MTIITSRRILHQPFFPASSFPPNQQPPFFPSYDSPPPPPTLTTPLTPPSPSAFASFPANVSSLDIPRSPKSNSSVSPSLLAVTIVAVLLAVFVVSVAVYYYCKRRDRHFGGNSDTKTYRSDNNSHRLYPISSITTNVTAAATNVNSTSVTVNGVDGINDGVIRKVRSNSSRPTSAEFLYLGNIANSRLVGDRGGRDSGNVSSGEVVAAGGGLGERKMDSPELRPLPPLARYGANSGNVGLNGEEEEDEFYSPNGSYYSAGGSGSGSVFAAAAAAAVVELMGTSSESNSSSCSSSNSGSPIRSKTNTTSIIASPASLDHRRTSPSLSASPSPPASSSPERSPVYATQPPPPPPPPPLMARNLESQTPSPPIIPQAVSKPPGLMISPPKPTPIVIQSPPKGSPETLAADKSEDETPKPKLKPLHWDKVRASSDREMVWDQLKSSSFKLNEEMIESLFVVNTSNSAAKETNRRSIHPSPVQENRVLDPKKSQNIAIALRALNVTVEEVCEALSEGNADTLGAEILESLLKMAPTKEEERKLKEYKDDSPYKLGPAERFLKEVLSIPFAFQRIDVMLYMANFESEVEYLKSSFETLEAACEELRNSRIFFKLLEAILKTGNRMNVGTNRGDAHAFKLDTLLKLVDVKAADGKTTLLHFVVQEIIKSEGARLSDSYNQIPNPSINEDAKCRKLGLQVVSNLRSELTNVKKAAAMESTVLTGEVIKLSNGIENIKGVMALTEEGKVKFSESANKFVNTAEEEIIRIQAQESVSLSLVKEITEYFHGNSAKEEAHPFRIFMVVRDFLTVLERVCKDVGAINERTIVSSAHKFPVPVNPTIQAALPVTHQREHHSSSDDESL